MMSGSAVFDIFDFPRNSTSSGFSENDFLSS
jgi:hypothetical protein